MLNSPSLSSKVRRHLLLSGMMCLVFAATIGLSTAAQAGAIRTGFTGNTLAPNDDGSTLLESIGFTTNFFGTNYTQLFVNNNGNVTFDNPLSTFTPFALLSSNRVIIAPYFADVDTRAASSNAVTYGQGTVDGRNAFGVNYVDVGFFSFGTPLNSFQLVLTDRSDVVAGDFDIEFNYDQILWETGTASGGNSSGLGGDSARVGYSNGVNTAFELPGSAVNGAFLDGGPAETSLINNSLNSNVLGRYVFNVRNGQVVDPNPSVPEPSSLAIFGIGALGLMARGVRRRKQKQTA